MKDKNTILICPYMKIFTRRSLAIKNMENKRMKNTVGKYW